MSSDRPHTDHQTLVTQATRGDENAAAVLLEQYLPRVRAFIRLRMNDALRKRESCSDLVQEVCVDLLRAQENFEYRGEAEFRSWLFQAALNKVRERQRFWMSNKRDVRREVKPAVGTDSTRLSQIYLTLGTPSRQIMAEEHMQRLEAAFDELPDHYRQVVTMARVAGLPHEEIAKQLGKTVGATRQILGRALIRLGDLMKEDSTS